MSQKNSGYLFEMRNFMAETGREAEAWWVDCPWCDYEGPEPPIPGLEPLPGFHEVWLCPSCRGQLDLDHPQVTRTIAAIDQAAREAKEAKHADD